jgi:hypothetical protein
MPKRRMFDSVDAADIPANAKIVLAYVDGPPRNIDQVKRRFPHAKIVTITIEGGQADADVVDCETGDVTPDHAAEWAALRLKAGKRPTIYMNASTWPAVRVAVQRAGIAKAFGHNYLVAEYDGDPTIPAGAIGKQFESPSANDSPGHYDISSLVDYWPGVDPLPKPHGFSILHRRTIRRATRILERRGEGIHPLTDAARDKTDALIEAAQSAKAA